MPLWNRLSIYGLFCGKKEDVSDRYLEKPDCCSKGRPPKNASPLSKFMHRVVKQLLLPDDDDDDDDDDDAWSHTSSTTTVASLDELLEDSDHEEEDFNGGAHLQLQILTHAPSQRRRSVRVDPTTALVDQRTRKPNVLSVLLSCVFGALLLGFLFVVSSRRKQRDSSAATTLRQGTSLAVVR
eukprot:scaffold4599_cov219-Amphora_coffeaeformis.AAC.5